MLKKIGMGIPKSENDQKSRIYIYIHLEFLKTKSHKNVFEEHYDAKHNISECYL